MEKEIKDNALTVRQRCLIFFYRITQHIINNYYFLVNKIKIFCNTFFFFLLVIFIFLYFLNLLFYYYNITILQENLYSLSFSIAWIIWASIAIIFSFSTFILQSTADLFSTQYLNKFIDNKEEKQSFWFLVFLAIISFLIPITYNDYIYWVDKVIVWDFYVIEILVFILFLAFYIIFNLYKELRKRLNPETTLKLIKDDAIQQLVKINKKLKRNSSIQNKIFQYKSESKDYSLDIQYKAYTNWSLLILEDIKYLYEIWLRLLSKNEINSFNLALKYIHDIWFKHFELRNNDFIRIPVNFFGTYTFNDEWFTSSIFEYLQSIWERLIEGKRKENIYFLLKIYESIIQISLNIKYADKDLDSYKDNPLTSLAITYYGNFIEKLISSKEHDWIWESIKSVSNVSNILLNNTSSYLLINNITQIIDKLSIYSLTEKKDYYLKELVNTYFNQIYISWDKYSDRILWDDIFKNLKKNILFLSVLSNNLNLSINEIFINYQTWQVNVINWIFELKIEDDQKKHLDNFIKLIKKISDFLLDIARDIWLENKQIWLSIIQSVENNLRIIYWIKNKFKDYDLDNIYDTQFYILSWYFQKVDKVDDSLLFNLDLVLEILLMEINSSLKDKIFDTKYLQELYIKLLEQHFEKVSIWYWYNHPRIIIKLSFLWLLYNKHKKVDEENIVIWKIIELNNKYLEINKDFFQKKKEIENLMWPDIYQLCEEFHELEKDIFSYNRFTIDRIENILKKEINKEIWDSFMKKIDYCKNVKYTTTYM